MLAWVTDPYKQEEIGLLLHSRSKEEHVWNMGDPLECLLVLPCPVIKDDSKLQFSNASRINSGPEL